MDFYRPGFFPKLLESLLEKEEYDQNWETSNIYCNGATFEIGFNREILLIICSKASTVRLKVRTLSEVESENLDAEISLIRNQFEQAIQQLMETNFKNLHCYVCTSTCFRGTQNSENYCCLQILGRIGEVGNKKLPSVRCPKHKEKLMSKSYEAWFYNERIHHANRGLPCKTDQRILNEVANRVIEYGMLRDIGIELGVDADAIKKAYNNHHCKIRDASFEVLVL